MNQKDGDGIMAEDNNRDTPLNDLYNFVNNLFAPSKRRIKKMVSRFYPNRSEEDKEEE